MRQILSRELGVGLVCGSNITRRVAMEDRFGDDRLRRIGQFVTDLLESAGRVAASSSDEARVVLDHPQRLAGAVEIGIEQSKDVSVHAMTRAAIIEDVNRLSTRALNFSPVSGEFPLELTVRTRGLHASAKAHGIHAGRVARCHRHHRIADVDSDPRAEQGASAGRGHCNAL